VKEAETRARQQRSIPAHCAHHSIPRRVLNHVRRRSLARGCEPDSHQCNQMNPRVIFTKDVWTDPACALQSSFETAYNNAMESFTPSRTRTVSTLRLLVQMKSTPLIINYPKPIQALLDLSAQITKDAMGQPF